MPPGGRGLAELQGQRDKLANSYQELLTEFNSKDLRTVGNYTVGRLIGKGSFGKVYLASHKLTNGSKVVLKSAKKDDPNLAREIHHHRQFVHPHIARLYEVIVTENLVWLVLEWCDELYNHLLNFGRMQESQVQKIFTQLVGAVSYVHMKGCVHRDLKLENILLDKHGSVKLVDFGFTREYQGTTSYLQTWCGTIAYSAPEMIKGEKYAGEKVDVWSLGIILYALLVGELPFDDDDDSVTKSRILKEEPKYPDHFPESAKDLANKLLSKRPLLRPSLPDILRHPWLSDHAPLQQEILKLQQPPPFSTQLEKEVLARMRSAGVDIDMVIEHVLAQRCDGLAGWWALLIEKEERKAKRKERKRREKEREEKALRRLSAQSGRLLGPPSLREINEEEQTTVLLGNPPKPRGRKPARSNASSTLKPDLPNVTEQRTPTPEPPPPIPKDPSRSTSSTRRRPAPPPKEYSRRPRTASRHSSSMLRVSHQNPELLSASNAAQKRKKLYQLTFRDQLATIKAWFRDPARKGKSPGSTNNGAQSMGDLGRESTPTALRRSSTAQILEMRKAEHSQSRPELHTRQTVPARPRLSTTSSYGSNHSGMTRAQAKRLSLSPQPLTPGSNSYRRRSGLGGRKSTSSSVSSVRSIHLTHPSGISHSKASSTSSASNSIASPNLSNPPGSRSGPSPHGSVKILPASPTTVTLPPSIRVQRRGPPGALGSLPTFTDMQSLSAPTSGAVGPSSPGMHAVFARQKRKVFKGPTGLGNSPRSSNQGTRNVTPTASSAGSREPSRKRQSVEIVGMASAVTITEEEEDEDADIAVIEETPRISMGIEEGDEDIEEEVEEVEAFSPVSEGLEVVEDIDGEGYFRSVHKADCVDEEPEHHEGVNGIIDKGKGKAEVEA
ncbi:Serine/threonine-protein kinase-like protein [Elsinoe fawcettii]|nr:Serine/threonine-protein kinase-like protein [Elsinoe fawcettii]